VAKTTSGFNSDRTIQQYAHGLLLECLFVQSSTDCLAVRANVMQNGHLSGHSSKTGSRSRGRGGRRGRGWYHSKEH